MFPISNETLQLLKNGTFQTIDMTILLKNGDTLTIENNNIVRGSLVVDRYVCERKLSIGNAVASELTFTLVNSDNEFESVDFEKALITLNIIVGEEIIPMGKFICEKPTQNATTITIYALDSMVKLDTLCPSDFIEVDDTIEIVVQKIVNLFSFDGYVIDNGLSNVFGLEHKVFSTVVLPSGTTFRRLVQMLAEIMGANAYFDYNNYLHFSSYATTDTFDLTPNDRFSSNYSSPSTIDGIKVVNLDQTYIAPSSTSESDTYVDSEKLILGIGASVVGTKVTFNSSFKNSLVVRKEKLLFGGFNTRPFEITNNILINYQYEVDNIYQDLLNGNVLTYTPFYASTKSYPHIYPMDLVMFTAKNGQIFNSIVTHVRFILNKNSIIESSGISDYQEETSEIPNNFLTNEELSNSESQSHRIVTTITEDTIATTNIIAENLQVRVANIIGTITANNIIVKDNSNQTIFSANADTKLVTIGGFNVTSTLIVADNSEVGLYSGSSNLVASLVTSGGSSELRYFAGNSNLITNSNFMVLRDGSVYCKAINISGGAISGTTLELMKDNGLSPSGQGNDIITKTLINFDELFLYRPIGHESQPTEFPLYIPINSFRYQATDYVLCILVMNRPSISTTWQLGIHFEFAVFTKVNYEALTKYSYDDDIHEIYS